MSESIPLIRLDPSVIKLEKNGSQTVYVSVIYRDPSGYDIRDGSQASFVITDPTIASVTPAGVVTGLKIGTTVLTVTVNGSSTTESVTVY